jgi:predicted amidohydrolase YtcJ
MHGRELTQLDLAECTGIEECLDRLREEADRLDGVDPSGRRWLLANGVRTESWVERRWPTLEEIDRATLGGGGTRRCAAVMSFDHHALVANSPALTAAGIEAGSADPPGGVIVRDQRGRMTGLLLEAACWRVRQRVPELSPAERLDALRAGIADLARHGFVQVHDLLSPSWLGPALAKLGRIGELGIEVWLYPAIDELVGVHAGRGEWESERVRLAGGKIFVDGTLNSRTAWVLTPYADGLAAWLRGQAMMTPAQMREALALTRRLGVGLAAHAIGDAAVRAMLDAGEELLRGQGGPDPGAGVPWLRIEHCELIDERDVPRFAELGVVCSVQPCHLLYDIEALERGCPGRLDRVLPLRELVEAGCRAGELLWFGSDAPIVRPDPMDSIIAATRRGRVVGSPGGPPSRTIAPGQAIDEVSAWAAFSASVR